MDHLTPETADCICHMSAIDTLVAGVCSFIALGMIVSLLL